MHTGLQDVIKELARAIRAGNVPATLRETHAKVAKMLRLAPRNPEGYFFMGLEAIELRRPEDAVVMLKQAARLGPRNPEYHHNLGAALSDLGRVDEARAAYVCALQRDPNYAPAWLNLGNLDWQIKDGNAAKRSYMKVLAIEPSSVDARCNLALIHRAQGDNDAAMQQYQAAKDWCSQPRALSGIGSILYSEGKYDEAIEHLLKAIAQEPSNVEANITLGDALQKTQQWQDAVDRYQAFLRIDPHSVDCLTNLGALYNIIGKLDAAEQCLQQALALQPECAKAWYNLGLVAERRDDFELAIVRYLCAVKHNPTFADAHNNVALAYQNVSSVEMALSHLREALRLKPDYAVAHSNLVLVMNYHDRYDERTLFEEARRWDVQHGMSHACETRPHTNDRDPDRPLRVGYVSPDFRYHSVSQFFRTLLQGHCRDVGFAGSARADLLLPKVVAWRDDFGSSSSIVGFAGSARADLLLPKVVAWRDDFGSSSSIVGFAGSARARNVVSYCYSDTPRSDALTEVLRASAGHWLDSSALTDRALADQVRADGIDILVDLTGHMAHNRLQMFSLKPAPVQVTWLGYPGTTGLSAMDYRFTDAVADPVGSADDAHSETLVRLPGGFLCYGEPDLAGEVGPLPAARAGHITFGSFNNLAKMSDETVEMWSALMREVDGSRLLLKSRALASEATRVKLATRFSRHGIDVDRLVLHSFLPQPEDHLRLYDEVDIGLDPHPYNGTTTTCEALWMGVPVVTLLGARHAARVGASILTQLDMRDLIARDPAELVAIASALAADKARLAELRQTLRERLRRSPLCDSAAFAAQIERSYREMWHVWCARSKDTSEVLSDIEFRSRADGWDRRVALGGAVHGSP